MVDALVDIETLPLRSREPRAREYVAEAIRCYQAGAYRASIVSTWIAVVFDLVDKVRELALGGDAEAVAVQNKYERYLEQIAADNPEGKRKALEFENALLETCATKFQLFDPHQLRDLRRLHMDRHQCAHPSFQRPGDPYRPTAEQARLYLRVAVDHVLSRPPVQGRAAIDEIKASVASQYFPKDLDGALTTLRGGPLLGARDSLVRGLVDGLVFGFVEPADPLYQRTAVAVALCAALELHRSSVEQQLHKQLSKLVNRVSDELLPHVAQLIVSVDGALDLLDEASSPRLQEFIRCAPADTVTPLLVPLAKASKYADIVRDRIAAFDFDELAKGINNFGLGHLAKGRALDLLSECKQWDPVNRAFIRLIDPLRDVLQADDIRRIFRMPTETGADLVGAHRYAPFIDFVRQHGLLSNEEIDDLLNTHNNGYLLPPEKRRSENAAQCDRTI